MPRRILRPLIHLLLVCLLGNLVLPMANPAPSAAAMPLQSTQTERQATAPIPSQPTAAPKPNLEGLPLAFVPNRGQTDAKVRFQAQTAAGSLFFTSNEVVLAFSNWNECIYRTGSPR
jgi:hypothetical protein